MKPILFLLASLNAGAQDTTHSPKDTIIVNRRADGRLFLSDSALHIYPSDTNKHAPFQKHGTYGRLMK